MTGFPWAAFGVNLAAAAGAALAVMLLTFVVALVKGVHRVVDVAWGLGFAAVALVSLGTSSGHGDDGRRLLVTALTCVWGLRLAGHIALRGRGHGEDPRYERMLARAPGHRDLYALRIVYLLQGALVWLVSLPVQAAMYLPGPMGWPALAGSAVWLVGLFFETVGDAQLARFRADPANRGRIMDRGLWSWTRHPNYFGDACVWWGLWLAGGAATGWVAALVTVPAPIAMTYFLVYATGARLLESLMMQRPGYRDYAERTPMFVPRPPRRPRPHRG